MFESYSKTSDANEITINGTKLTLTSHCKDDETYSKALKSVESKLPKGFTPNKELICKDFLLTIETIKELGEGSMNTTYLINKNKEHVQQYVFRISNKKEEEEEDIMNELSGLFMQSYLQSL